MQRKNAGSPVHIHRHRQTDTHRHTHTLRLKLNHISCYNVWRQVWMERRTEQLKTDFVNIYRERMRDFSSNHVTLRHIAKAVGWNLRHLYWSPSMFNCLLCRKCCNWWVFSMAIFHVKDDSHSVRKLLVDWLWFFCVDGGCCSCFPQPAQFHRVDTFAWRYSFEGIHLKGVPHCMIQLCKLSGCRCFCPLANNLTPLKETDLVLFCCIRSAS